VVGRYGCKLQYIRSLIHNNLSHSAVLGASMLHSARDGNCAAIPCRNFGYHNPGRFSSKPVVQRAVQLHSAKRPLPMCNRKMLTRTCIHGNDATESGTIMSLGLSLMYLPAHVHGTAQNNNRTNIKVQSISEWATAWRSVQHLARPCLLVLPNQLPSVGPFQSSCTTIILHHSLHHHLLTACAAVSSRQATREALEDCSRPGTAPVVIGAAQV
jgi:hypothetical protein